MKIFVADIYVKTIYDINYDKLKEMGIICLIFDLDNTLARIDDEVPSEKMIKFLAKLKKDFDVYVLSNNTNKKRVSSFCEPLGVEYVSGALKPSSFGLSKIARKKRYHKSEMILIGDQIMTDVLAGKLYQIKTALVEALAKKDLKVTVINRFFERIVLKRLASKKLFEKGKYYD